MNNFFEGYEEYENPLFGWIRLPSIQISEEERKEINAPEGCSNYDFLRQLSLKGFRLLCPTSEKEQWIERAKKELELLNKLGYIDYILLVWKAINGARNKNISVGPGRGSVSGSLIAYLIGITEIPPIKYKLFFERFVSEVRSKKKEVNGITYIDGSLAPDIDIDIEQKRRHEVVQYMHELYPGRVVKISNVSTLSGKALIKECCKTIADINEDDCKVVSDYIPKKFGIVADLKDSYYGKKNNDGEWKQEPVEKFIKWVDSSKTNTKVFKIALKLRDLVKNKSSHASGYVISYSPLDEYIPCELAKKEDESGDKEVVSTYTMEYIAKLTIKVDFLGLRCLSVVSDVLRQININRKDINLDDDPNIYNQLQDLRTPHGLFQIEAHTNLQVCNAVKPKRLSELSDVLAMARPGALSYVSDYADSKAKLVDPVFTTILGGSRNVCLYQEQAMAMGHKLGLSLDEAEQLRRCVTGDTLFLSKKRGWISINRLLVDGYSDDVFLTLDDKGVKKWKNISNIWSTGTHQIKYVETNNGLSVKATQYHQFLTNTGWKARKRLKLSDFLLGPSEVEWEGEDKINVNIIYMLMGIICEGYFVWGNSSTFVAWDKENMNEFCHWHEEIFGYIPYLDKDGKIATLKKHAKETLHEYLEYGKSASKHIPDFMMGLKKETTRKILALFFTYEGHFRSIFGGKGEEIFGGPSACSASEKLIKQIQLLLLRFGIHCNIYKKWNDEYKRFYWHLDISQHVAVKRFKKEIYPLLSSLKKTEFDEKFRENKVITNSYNQIPQNITTKMLDQYPNASKGFESGSLYKSNISREKFLKIAKQTNDKEWIDLANGNQIYYKIDNIDKEIREIETFDFTVDEDTPHIVANGLVIHNCIGKKKIEEMQTWKGRLYEACNQNGFSIETANAMWKILEDSAAYQFNLSHSVSYASLSALTVYLKFNYPKEFYCSLLKETTEEAKPLEEIAKIQGELKNFDIKLLPPNLLKSDLEFKIEGRDIRFGLGSIKGISTKIASRLAGFKQEYSNKFELFNGAKQNELNISTLCALIYCGCMDEKDYTQSRARLALEAQLWNCLTDREKTLAFQFGEQFKYDVLATVNYLKNTNDSKGKPYIKESRFETIKKKYHPHKEIYERNKNHMRLAKFFFEKNFLGYTYSTDLWTIFKDQPGVRDLMSIQECLDADDQYLEFVGVVEEEKSWTSKKGNKCMKLRVSDGVSSLETIISNSANEDKLEAIKNYNQGNLPKENDICHFIAQKKGQSIFIQKIGIQNTRIITKYAQIKKEKEELDAANNADK